MIIRENVEYYDTNYLMRTKKKYIIKSSIGSGFNPGIIIGEVQLE